MRSLLLLAALGLGLVGCAQHSKEHTPTVLAAYTMLAPSTSDAVNIYARVIVDGVLTNSGQCPALLSESKTVVMKLRGQRPDADNFPVTVCEAKLLENTQYQVAGTDDILGPVTLNPTHIQIYGDTGCKQKHCADDSVAEPFNTLADIGAGEAPELLLHMGDYNYRGTGGALSGDIYAYDAGDGDFGGPTCGLEETYYSQNAKNSPKPDTWVAWQADFFSATKLLSSTAPWVFARGNHELCSRAGIGWFYFFGPGAELANGIAPQRCPDQGDFNQPPATASAHIQMIDPYALELENLKLWVMDTANACDDKATNSLTAQYQDQYKQLQLNAAMTLEKPIWVMSHRPIWGVNNPQKNETLNVMLQTAISQTEQASLPDSVALSLAGHMHIFQSSTFVEGARPPQLVIGNSGVSLSKKLPFTQFGYTLDSQKATVNTQGKHGFLDVHIQSGNDWEGKMLGKSAKSFLKCSSKLAKAGAVCEPAK
ncbi:metallophosphoesterase [Pseudoalteromonas sp. T1lg65]|uniref:metallophosphoesterase n=1 Tax=Pseudoalteromonas sp. T1lg65 TaxID=2077101 RepID=UPI003F79D3C1